MSSPRARRCAALVFATLLSVALPATAQPNSHGPQLGRVTMPVGCSEEAQKAFDQGLLHQHSFDHAVALQLFHSALQTDPTCTMASWGMALAALDNLFETPALADRQRAIEILRAAPPAPEPWRDWIAALSELAGADAAQWHDALIRYTARLERLAAARPDHDETQVFFALSLLMSAPADDRLAAAHRQAAAILEPIWARQPEHPGAMHYLIHAYDTPDLADQGMAAAQRYAQVAAGSPHAVHMPTHIFSRRGLWQASIASNQRSAQMARDNSLPNDELHARDYLVYALLQMGRTAEAQRAWAEAAPVLPRANLTHLAGPFAIAAMPARIALESGDWRAAAALPVPETSFPQVAALVRFARGVGLVRSGRPAEAAAEVAALATLDATLRTGNQLAWADQVQAQRNAVAALAAIATGDTAGGLGSLQQAADAEDSLLKSVVVPGPLAPARELLGEALLALGRNREAEAAFEASLRSNPGRFRSLAGAAAAAQADGRPQVAAARYRLLLQTAAGADPERPELRAANQALGR